jgi:hypothetical protein
VSQVISELGASGAPHGALVSAAGFAPVGVLGLAFLGLARPFLPPSRWTTPGLHNLFGLLAYAGAVAGLLVLGASFRACPRWRGAAPACSAAAGFVAMGLLAMLVPELASLRGLAQRIAEAAIFLWIAAAAVRLRRGGGSLAPAPERRAAKEPA